MGEAFRLGGWGMYPTALAGLVLIGASIKFAMAPDRRGFVFCAWLEVLTFLVGALGFVSGFIKAATSVPPGERDLVIVGMGEAANCIGCAICSMVLGGIFIAVGLGRGRRDASGALVDPLRG